MLKKVLVALAVLIAGFGAFVSTRPDTYHIERSATFAAPVQIPFAMVNDFHRWHYWSPWEALDPKMKVSFDGPYAGPGAIYAWSGNDKAGEGKMTLLETNLYSSIRIQLEFTRPMQDASTITFTFAPVPEGTKVTWAMDGKHTFMSKAFCLFMNLDSMVGPDFEKGLASMKALAEPEAKKFIEMEARKKAAQEAAAAAAAEQAPAPAAAPEQGAQAGATAP
jgi:hypothetical protein